MQTKKLARTSTKAIEKKPRISKAEREFARGERDLMSWEPITNTLLNDARYMLRHRFATEQTARQGKTVTATEVLHARGLLRE